MISLHNFQDGWVDQGLTQLAVMVLCDNSTGCHEVDDYFGTEADKMIDIAYKDDLN